MVVKKVLTLLVQKGFDEKYILGIHHYFENSNGKSIVFCFDSLEDIISIGTYKAVIKQLC